MISHMHTDVRKGMLKTIPVFLLFLWSSTVRGQIEDKPDVPKALREHLGFIPVGERGRLEHRLQKAWLDLVNTNPQRDVTQSFYDLRTNIKSVAHSLYEHSCPLWEINSEWHRSAVKTREQNLTPEEMSAYRARHDPLALRALNLGMEYLDLSIRTAVDSGSISSEDRATVLGQIDSIMDTVDDLIRPYFPKDPAKAAVAKAVLAHQRKHLKESGLFVRERPSATDSRSPLRRPLTRREIEGILDAIRVTVAKHGKEIPILVATGDWRTDLEAYYDDTRNDLIGWVIEGTLQPALLEIGTQDGVMSLLKEKMEEFERVAKEHRMLDTKTYFRALRRQNNEHGAGNGAKEKEVRHDPLTRGSEASKSGELMPSPEGGARNNSRPHIESTRSKIWLVVGLLVLVALFMTGSWAIRRNSRRAHR